MRAILMGMLLVVSGRAAPAGTVFVDGAASPGGDGTSWATALRDLAAALGTAQSGDEVRVAQGLYRPAAPGGPRTASFVVGEGVVMRGGYAGVQSATPGARDPSVFVTTLSGDLNGDDAPGFLNRGDNAFNVVRAIPQNGETTLDGLRIVGGNANGGTSGTLFQDRGGGVFADGTPALPVAALVRLIDCALEDNSAGLGGGLSARYTSVRAERCRFVANRAISGGSLGGGGAGFNPGFATGSRYEFIGCRFQGNTSVLFGGGVVVFGQGIRLDLSGCVFEGNTAPGGAGVYTSMGGDASAINCLFTGNASSSAPAWFDDQSRTLRLAHCTAVGNIASGTPTVGSVFRFIGLDDVLTNSIVRGNAATGGAVTGLGGNTSVRYSNIEGGMAGTGNIDADAGFRDAAGGDYRLRRLSPCVDAASNAEVLADRFDLDGDGNVAEATPFDLVGGSRSLDDPASAPNGMSVADMGALERTKCAGDADDDLAVTFADLNLVLGQFGQSGAIGSLAGDLDGDGAVTFADLNAVLGAFGGGCV